MGALTNERKRGDDYYYTLNYRSPSSSSPDSNSPDDSHIPKKSKYSPSLHRENSSSSKSAASKVCQYPTPVQQLRREVHAPCRAPKFGSFRSNSGGVRHGGNSSELDTIGNLLLDRYRRAKSGAFSTFRYHDVDKVIGIEQETVKDDVSEDSSVEEVVALVEDKKGEELPLVLDQRSRETDEILANLKRLDEKDTKGRFQPSSSSGVLDFSNGKMGSLSLNEELDALRVPVYKKLFDSAKKSDEKLSTLSLQIRYQESLRDTHLITQSKKREEDLATEPFVPLSNDEEAEVARAFSRPNRNMILVTHGNSNIDITVEKLRCLRPRAWLNDEVINVYLELLKEREKREPRKYLKCHFFSTFFYKKLFSGRNSYDFKSVKRWTTQRKLGYCLLDCDKIFVPIHKEVHWCLAVINKKDKKFQYLDSLKGVDRQVMKVLARYIVDEVKDKSGKDIDVNSWKQEYVQDLPDQENGYDCGMFMMKYADFYSRDIGLCFKQEHMPYFRVRTAKEILRLTAE